jgi:hypothetical protein
LIEKSNIVRGGIAPAVLWKRKNRCRCHGQPRQAMMALQLLTTVRLLILGRIGYRQGVGSLYQHDGESLTFRRAKWGRMRAVAEAGA